MLIAVLTQASGVSEPEADDVQHELPAVVLRRKVAIYVRQAKQPTPFRICECQCLLALHVMVFELSHQHWQAAVQGGGNPDDTHEIRGGSTSLNH
ncbi:hypothetical protein LXT13_11035 [Pelomonas sp. P8]|uniref:Secreted protein n=1 Tax=Pelomonas cellulosilytica TaxID=2906762 RepID=A0ABS8XTB0_9BURK|nr:hypothetical protein [Pelomonas sp. P8]MCE4554960.1 hypothetical protein [Pelomonas sp. P8]